MEKRKKKITKKAEDDIVCSDPEFQAGVLSIVRVVVEGGEVLQGGAVAELVLVLGNKDHVEVLIQDGGIVSELVLSNQDHVEVLIQDGRIVSELVMVLSNYDHFEVLIQDGWIVQNWYWS